MHTGSPQRGDLVAIEVRLEVDGQVLLDTRQRGRAIALVYGSRPLSGGLTRGIEEGIANMRTGGKRVLVVPPALGYGSEGAILTPNPKKPEQTVRVPPDAELRYEVELMRVSIAPA